MWAAFNQIEKSDEISEIYNLFQRPINKKFKLIELLKETGKKLRYNLEHALEYFNFERNINDINDTINLKDITIEEYKRRLGNFMLQQIFLSGSYNISLKELIKEIRYDDNYKEKDMSIRIEKSDIISKLNLEDEDKKIKILDDSGDLNNIEKFFEKKLTGKKNHNVEEEKKGFDLVKNPFDFDESLSNRKTREYQEDKKREHKEEEKREFQVEVKRDFQEESKKDLKEGIIPMTQVEVAPQKEIKKAGNVALQRSLTKKLTIKDDLADLGDDGSFFKNPPSLYMIRENSYKKPDIKDSLIDTNTIQDNIIKNQKKPEAIVSLTEPNDEQSELISRTIDFDRKNTNEIKENIEFPSKLDKSDTINNTEKEDIQESYAFTSINNKGSNFIQSESTENLLQQHIKQEIPEKILGSWFRNLIIGKEDQIIPYFSSKNENKDYITVNELPQLFDTITCILKIPVQNYHKRIFKEIYQHLYPIKIIQKPNKKSTTIYPKITLENFIELMNIWGEKYTQDEEKIADCITKTIQEYQELNNEYINFPQISDILKNLNISLQLCLTNYIDAHKEQKNLKNKHKKNLEDIFLFYAKVQKIQGTDNTFESMETNNNTWNLGKFLKFCNDFSIIIGKTQEKRALSKEELACIFKKIAIHTRLMNEPHFVESLDRIAEAFYSPDLDKLLNTNFSSLPIAEKRELFYRYLGIDENIEYKNKKKTFGIAFSPEKLSRIPVSGSSHKYEFKLDESSQKRLELWKLTRIARSTPALLKPVKESPKISSSLRKKSPKVLPTSGYALRLKSKKNETEVNIEEKYYSPQSITYRHTIKEENDIKPKVITIKNINNMAYKDFDEENAIKDLISEESDDYFDRLYGIEPKLQGIMKMHDDKLAKGQRVIEKNRLPIKNA